jgi:hypothetical protein
MGIAKLYRSLEMKLKVILLMVRPKNIWANRLAELSLVQRDSGLPFSPEADSLRVILMKLREVKEYCVDTAASNGVHSSATYPFLKLGWNGLAVEMHPGKFSALSYVYQDLENVALVRQMITPLNIVAIFNSHNVPQNFGIWNVDIDSYDLFVVKAVLESDYRPALISIEINEKIPFTLYFTVLFDPLHHWQGDHFYGCSLAAAYEEIVPFGYQLIEVRMENAIFGRIDVVGNNFPKKNIRDAFQEGYMDLENREALFPWNKEVDYLHHISPEDAIREIDFLFHSYNGLYEVRKSLLNES